MKFTVTAGADAAVPATNATVGFAFNVAAVGPTNASATQAGDASFVGLSTGVTANQEFVPVARVRAGAKRTYEARRTFRLNHDLDAEHGKFSLTGQAIWSDETADMVGTAVYIIADDETQSYALSIPRANKGAIIEGGDAADVTLTADPKRTATATVPDFTIVTDPPGRLYSFTEDSDFGNVDTALSTGNEGASAMDLAGTIAANGDKNRENDTVTLKLYSGTVGAAKVLHELPITVVDVNALAPPAAITAEAKDEDGNDATEIMEGGDPVYLTITVDRR